MDNNTTLKEIKQFLDGRNNDYKYIVNVETNPNTNYAECVVHEPDKEPRIERIHYEPFLYMKDLSKYNIKLYDDVSDEYHESKKIKYGITITKLETGNQKRLLDGFCYKITSSRSFNSIIEYLKDGGIDPYEKLYDSDGKLVRDNKNNIAYKNKHLFYSVKTTEQFLISTGIRLYKGIDDYKNIHRLIFDIETEGLRYQIHRILSIGIYSNKGFETILDVDKFDDDDAEIKLIQDFFNLINYLKPAIIAGFNSEMFDFEFILGRAKLLRMDLSQIPTSLKFDIPLKRVPNTSVKYGSTTDKYTWTNMWGYSVIDILHSAKRTAAINRDIKETGLKYLAKFEGVAKPNRTYIDGEDNTIGKYYRENKIFLINDKNEYIQIPDEFQTIARELYILQVNKSKLSDIEYNKKKINILNKNKNFVYWYKNEGLPKNLNRFISGKNLVKQYLLDDLWETYQIDELYNQTSFMLAKNVPTTYQRICTMGTASIWNILLTAWSYENDIAIPESDEYEFFSGGLSRCFKKGYSKRIIKIDYASLYPMLQLTWDIFPDFDITGVMKKMLLYFTTTRNIYKHIASNSNLSDEEVGLLEQIDHDFFEKIINNNIQTDDVLKAKIKQLPIKILNNSLFGALGSNISFNWSDNNCAARITSCGRLSLRHAISWFKKYNCQPLLAVTDGINFQIPDTTTIRVSDDNVYYNQPEDLIENMWQYRGFRGIDALIEKFNAEEMIPPYMKVDNDGYSISCLNLSRINYATLVEVKDKKTGQLKEKIKLTGNTIKSNVMPEYIEEFIDKALDLILHGKGEEFVKYYYDYVDDIRYMQIPLHKIASKSRVKTTIKGYLNRGMDKNGRDKGKQAHMELIIEQRKMIAEKLFEEHITEFADNVVNDNITIEEKMKLVSNYMPPEPELDSYVYYVNCGYNKSHGDSSIIVDKKTGKKRFAAVLVDLNNPENNPKEYNYVKYLDAFNKRVKTLLVGFESDVADRILVKINRNGDLIKSEFNPLKNELELKSFDLDDFEESLYLEKSEVDFWNKTGYDPRKVWNGFKMFDDYKVHYEIYENALNYLNEKMKKANKNLIKSINDNYNIGDYVLVKNGKQYNIAKYNGIYLQTIRYDVEVPKSQIEIELDKRYEENKKPIDNLKESELDKTDRELFLEKQLNKRLELFMKFKQKYGIPLSATMETVFSQIENSEMAFNDFVNENSNDNELDDEYIDVDDYIDDTY